MGTRSNVLMRQHRGRHCWAYGNHHGNGHVRTTERRLALRYESVADDGWYDVGADGTRILRKEPTMTERSKHDQPDPDEVETTTTTEAPDGETTTTTEPAEPVEPEV